MGRVRVQSQQTYETLSPTALTAYKALSFINLDSMAISSGSAVGESTTVYENVDSNQGAICLWYYPLNYGNAGQTRYLFDCYVDANNRISLYINASNNLVLDVIGASTTRSCNTSFATIKPFTWNHIVATWSKNVDVKDTNNSYVYLNGSGAGQTSATTAMSSVPSSFYIGSDYNGKMSANGLIAYKVMRYWMSETQVTADYNSGNGSTEFFTRTPHTIAMGLTSESSTGTAYVHRGQAIESISTVTLTLKSAIGGRSWTNGNRVVVYDDANPPNIVRTTINGVPSGSTIVVADSCAGIVGTNKFISKNLIADDDAELSTTGAWTASGATLSKNTTTPIADVADLKVVNDGGSQGLARQTITTASGEDYYFYALHKGATTPNGASQLVNVDADASKGITVTQAGVSAGVTGEVEFSFEAGDTSTDVDLGSGSVTASEIGYWDNVKVFANSVNNGGCEGGADPPTSWVQEANATVVSDTSPHAGTNCLKVTAGANNVGASQAVTLVSGQYYTIVGYCKATAGDSARVIIDTGDTTLLTVGTVTATTWTRVRISFKATGTSGNVYLRGVTNTDVVYFDDIAIIRDDIGSVTATKGAGIIPSNQPAVIIQSSPSSPSYSNTGGSGDRTSIITVSNPGGYFSGSGGLNTFINGINPENALWFATSYNLSDNHIVIMFDFGSGASKVIDEAKWYQSTTTAHGIWKWQGSNNNSDWTDIGSTFTLGGATTQTQTELSGNTTGYRYYRLYAVSGFCSDTPYLYELEFKIY